MYIYFIYIYINNIYIYIHEYIWKHIDSTYKTMCCIMKCHEMWVAKKWFELFAKYLADPASLQTVTNVKRQF